MVVGVIDDSPTPKNALGIASVIKFLASPEMPVNMLQTTTPIPIIFVLLYLSASIPINNPAIVYGKIKTKPVSKPNSESVS